MGYIESLVLDLHQCLARSVGCWLFFCQSAIGFIPLRSLLFATLEKHKSQKGLTVRIFDLPPFFRPSVSLRNKGRLPAKPGVYYAIQWWKPLKPLYVGMSGNLRARWNSRSYGEHHHYSALARRFGVRLHYVLLKLNRPQKDSKRSRFVATVHL
ncbi:MAG: hypothetical protein LH660_07015 [Phormidesmis sp. CAN_BIN36]|nr:hypothetical protein [Phormidesmis sp. CAN_BIN36]